MAAVRQLPNIAQVLGPLLQRVPVEHQPLLVAVAERMAAERYREWADQVAQSDRKASLLACAAREEKIAEQAEALYPASASIQRELLARNPDLAAINRSLFAPFSLADQFALQAQGERVGAATWKSFAEHGRNSRARDVFLSNALLEEENAAFLESIINEQG